MPNNVIMKATNEDVTVEERCDLGRNVEADFEEDMSTTLYSVFVALDKVKMDRDETKTVITITFTN